MRSFATLLCLAVAASSIPIIVSADANVADGCMNQQLFNGIWRVQITSVEPYMDGGRQTGWQVSETWRNGTKGALAPSDSALDNQTLELSNGSISAKDSTTGTLSMQNLGANTFAPAGQFSYKQIFISPAFDASNKPKALSIAFDAARLSQMKSKPQFSTRQYNYHVKFDCTSAPGASSQAQGGSTQLAAGEGCLNQWMSNGVWKMRVTAVVPRYLGENDPSTNQTGWWVKQEWTNVTNRRVFPGTLPSGPVVQTNVTDEYLVTKSGNNASSANAAGDMQALTNHPFAPGETFAYEQSFSWGGFDKSDTPVRLLVTFDAAKQNALPGLPHYRKPANFRINLDCPSP